jgi:hypothetical protein
MKFNRADYQNRIIDLAKLIPDDEPVFLIRASDIVGPSAVRHWAKIAEQSGATAGMVADALIQANQMDGWQRKHGKKIPDIPKRG